MPVTWLDLLLLGVMLISGLLAMIRGFMREVLSIVAWLAAAIAAYWAVRDGRLLAIAKANIASDTLATVATVAVVFLVTLLIVSVITVRISDMILDSRIGALDRTLGFLFGAARGILLVVVAMLFFNWLVAPQQQPVWVTHAKSKPLLDNLGNQLVALLPEEADATILDRLRGKDTTGEGEGETPPAQTEQAPGEEAPATNG